MRTWITSNAIRHALQPACPAGSTQRDDKTSRRRTSALKNPLRKVRKTALLNPSVLPHASGNVSNSDHMPHCAVLQRGTNHRRRANNSSPFACQRAERGSRDVAEPTPLVVSIKIRTHDQTCPRAPVPPDPANQHRSEI